MHLTTVRLAATSHSGLLAATAEGIGALMVLEQADPTTVRSMTWTGEYRLINLSARRYVQNTHPTGAGPLSRTVQGWAGLKVRAALSIVPATQKTDVAARYAARSTKRKLR